MLRETITEFGRIQRDTLGERLLRRLQRFDEQNSRAAGDFIFDWSHIKYIRARSYVGVVQIEGLVIEILPKINAGDLDEHQDSPDPWSRANLLYMLSISRNLPIKERDLALQNFQNMPLMEALIALFASRLLDELRCGLDHEYLCHEENSAIVKGRIMLSQHLKTNAGRLDRTLVAYDDFSADTYLNRILKLTCQRLLGQTTVAATEQKLRIAILQLADVSDISIEKHHFSKVHLNRSSERFVPLLEFCRLVYEQMAPTASAGTAATFSLLFPMDKLFEDFIGRFIQKFAADFGLVRKRIHLQAKNRRRWLLRRDDGDGVFRLKPDILIDGDSGIPEIVIDTKWKRLLADKEDRKNGVSYADIYQLYAYANRYGAKDNILLYPRVPGTTAKSYWLEEDAHNRCIRTGFVDLSYDIARNPQRLKVDLHAAISRFTPSQKNGSRTGTMNQASTSLGCFYCDK